MDVGGALRRGWRIARFNREAVRQVAADPRATIPGLIVLAIAGLLWAGGCTIVAGPATLLFVVPCVVVMLLFASIGIGVWHLLALLLGGEGRYTAFFRTWAHGGGLAAWLGVVPYAGAVIGGIWGLVIAVPVIEEVHRLSRGKAIAVILIPVILGVLCCSAALMLIGAAIWAAIRSGFQMA
jgi:hypothetical protein